MRNGFYHSKLKPLYASFGEKVLFENEEYKVEAEKKEGCLLEVKIGVAKECVQKAHKKAIKNVNKEVSLPGFRKGKVPEEAILKKFGHHVEQEWKELLVTDAVNSSFSLTKIYPLTKNSINKPKIEKCSQEDGASISFSYEYYPLVPHIDFSSVKLSQKEAPKVTQEEVQDVLDEILESRAEWSEIKDRPIAEGDYVDLTIDAIIGDTVKPISRKRRFQVTSKRMGEWMRTLLIGKQTGEIVEGESRADENASAEIKEKFQKTHVRITIHAIYQAQLSELNDDFAQKVGAPNLEALKERIYQDLFAEGEQELNDKRFEELRNLLIEKYPFDIPFSLKKEEIQNRKESKIQELKNQNVSDEDIQKQEKEIEKELEVISEKSLRIYFLNQQIARQGKITVSQEEINQALSKQYMFRGMKDISEDLMSRLSNTIFLEKIKAYALSQLPS